MSKNESFLTKLNETSLVDRMQVFKSYNVKFERYASDSNIAYVFLNDPCSYVKFTSCRQKRHLQFEDSESVQTPETRRGDGIECIRIRF